MPETSRPLRLVIAGGGTGGHLFPGIALAEAATARGAEVWFVGTDRGLEARVVPEQGYRLERIDVAGIKGRGLAGLLRGVGRLPRAGLASRALLRRLEPDVVVGVGGYASGPVVATAAWMGIPTAILEQNSLPGLTNRILGRVVRRVFTTFPDPQGHFPARKVIVTGNPIRAELRERLARVGGDGRTGPARHLFVFGGSQGAHRINEAIAAALPALTAALPGLGLLHQTGEGDLEAVTAAYAAAGLTPPRGRVVPFIRDMAGAYAWADLVVCRAGATSLAELSVVGRPAVLVPFPHAADDHQVHNARALVERGAAVLLPESELSTESLVNLLTGLLDDSARLERMAQAMSDAARPRAAEDVLDALVAMAHGPSL